MKYPSDHKANTRRRILEEAARAICAQGADGIAIAPVMAAAGMTVGGFYAHFRSKEDLVAETIGFMFDERYASFFASNGGTDPRETLRRFVDYYLSVRHCRADVPGCCPIPILAGQVPHLSEAGRERFVAAVDRLTDGVGELLKASGTVRPTELAALVMAEMIGAISLARVITDPARSEALLQDARRSVGSKLGLPD